MGSDEGAPAPFHATSPLASATSCFSSEAASDSGPSRVRAKRGAMASRSFTPTYLLEYFEANLIFV